MAQVFVGLGSNVEPLRNLARAMQVLKAHYALNASPAYRNPARGFAGEDFVNLVVEFSTAESLATVLATLKRTELALGRDLSQPRFAPKVIDLDLLFYGDVVLRHDRLELPPQHIEDYYLRPLSDLAPEWVNPTTMETASEAWRAAQATAAQSTAVELPEPPSADRAELILERLRFAANLGVGEAERAEVQDVFVSLRGRFAEIPGACASDDLVETVDYVLLRDALAETIEAREFRTIEHLCECALLTLVECLPEMEHLEVEVHKYPDVTGMDGGARFRLTRSG